MTKDPWLFLEGGWKLRCESLGSLRYFLHGLVERVGDIVQVVHGADKSRNGQKTTLPLNGVEPGQGQFWNTRSSQQWCWARAGPVLKHQKQPAVMLSQGRASSETEAASSDVEPGQTQFWNTRSSQQWCWARAGPVLKHQKQPAVMLRQGRASSETPEAASSDVEPGQGPVLKHQKQPAVMLRQGRASSETPEAASSDVEPGQTQFWNTRSSQQWCWARAGPVLKHQKQPAVMLSQGRASSETPEAASSDVEAGQGQFWNTRSSQQWCWARAGPVLKHQKQPAVMLSQGRASSETPEAASSDVEPGQGQFWNTRSSQQWCWGRAGPVLKHQKQPAVMLSQGRASSETPEAASSDVEPGQGQFWNTRSSQQWCWARAGPVLKHQKQPAVMLRQGRASSETPEAASQWYVDSTQSHSLFCGGGACVIEPITKDPLEGVLF